MARFPKIDSPCPLGIDEQRRLQGFCQHCQKQVHALDALDDEQRQALLKGAQGSICVSYRVTVPVRRPAALGLSALGMAGLGMAIATTFASGAAFADAGAMLAGGGPAQSVLSPAPANAAMSTAGQPGVNEVVVVAGGVRALSEEIFVGGVAEAQDAAWIDDSALPELPVRTLAPDDDVWGPSQDADEDRAGS